MRKLWVLVMIFFVILWPVLFFITVRYGMMIGVTTGTLLNLMSISRFIVMPLYTSMSDTIIKGICILLYELEKCSLFMYCDGV